MNAIINNSKIQELESKIRKASQDYYLGVSEVSDIEFDSWVEELKLLDSENSILTQVGWGLKVYGKKIKHKDPIRVSIPKIHSIDELIKAGVCESDIILFSLKLDGITVCLEYENGILKNAITRGDGVEGIDVTEKFKSGKIKIEVPIEKGINNFTGVLRGEAIITYNDFEKLKDQYSNPRNAVSGIINGKTFNNLEYVTFFIHPESLIQTNCLMFYRGLVAGLEPVNGLSPKVFNKSEHTVEYFKKFYDTYKNIYPIDGIVIQSLDNNTRKINITRALKFETEVLRTKVKNVEWIESLKGTLIPVVEFESVNLYGANISKATGISFEYIISNGIIPGVEINVTRANEVIPQIINVENPVSEEVAVKYYRTHIENFESLERSGVHLINNSTLESRMVWSFANYHLRFKGFNKADSFVYDGLEIKSLLDYSSRILEYSSHKEDLIPIALQFSNSSTVDHLVSIFTSQYSLNGFFSQFGLRGFGWENAILLDPYIESIFTNSIDIDQLPVNITCKNWLKNEKVFTILKDFYYDFKYRNLWYYDKNDSFPVSEVLDTVVITGSLPLSRSEISNRFKSIGIEVLENIKDKKVSTLICDKPSSSSKYKYASENNIQILNLEEYCRKMNINYNNFIKEKNV